MTTEQLYERLIKKETNYGINITQVTLHDESVIGISYLGFPHLLTIEHLEYGKWLIDNTLAYYREMGWSEDDVKRLSHQMSSECEDEFQRKMEERVEARKAAKKRKKNKKTTIYIIRDSSNSALKIGNSIDPESRLRGLQISTSSKLELVGTFNGHESDEKAIHKTLKELGFHLAGEWFKDTEETIKIVNDHFGIA